MTRARGAPGHPPARSDRSDRTDRPSSPRPWVLLVALFAVAANLRIVMTSVPPLVDAIRVDLGLSSGWVGILTTLPVLCMGVFAPVAPRLAARVGPAAVVELGLGSALAGSALRGLVDGVAALYLGTFAAGVGIAVVGALLPQLVKQLFPPGRAGLMTGVYMLAMMSSATAAAAASVPLTELLGSWEASLASWALVAAVALVAWLPVLRLERHHHRLQAPAGVVAHALPWRHPTAWLVAGYLSVQSTQFYTTMAWLSPAYVERGWDVGTAGYLLSVLTGGQLVSGLLGPALTDKVADRRRLLLPCTGLGGLGLLGVLVAPDLAPWVWAAVLGLGQGAAFSVALVLLVDYAGTPSASGRLTAMCFLISYSLAALGPAAAGALRDLTGGFPVIWTGLLILVAVQTALAGLLRPTLSRVP